MKRLFIVFLISLLFVSCASLQEDVYISSNLNSVIFDSIDEYENHFITIDNKIALGKTVPTAEITNLISSIDSYYTANNSNHMEPALKARIEALKGLLYVFLGRTSKAEDLFKTAKANQSGDIYVQILNTRLDSKKENQLVKINTYLKIDPENPVLLLNKAITLYQMQNYSEALAAIDKAFLLFDKNDLKNYSLAYEELQDKIFEMYRLSNNTSYTANISAAELEKTLTVTTLVQYTVDNSNLLNFFTAGNKIKTSELVKRLEKNGYFSAPTDKNNSKNTSAEITKSKALTKEMCARFLWNIFTQSKNKQNQINKYSNRYAKIPKAVSPVADVQIENDDLDAILGLIENEIMELPDGKHFYPDDKVTVMEYLIYLGKADNK